MSDAVLPEVPEAIEFNLSYMGVSQSDWPVIENSFMAWTNMVASVTLSKKTGVISVTPKFAVKDRAKWEHKAEDFRRSLEDIINSKKKSSTGSSFDRNYQNTTGRSGARR